MSGHRRSAHVPRLGRCRAPGMFPYRPRQHGTELSQASCAWVVRLVARAGRRRGPDVLLTRLWCATADMEALPL